MPLIQLALPLPAGYATVMKDDFAFLQGGGSPGTLPAELESYLNDLCGFIRKTRSIQRHPEDFFDFDAPTGTAELDRTLTGRPVEPAEEEEAYMISLCESFGALLGETDLSGIDTSQLVRSGPPSASTELYRFYELTRSVQLFRKRSNSVCLERTLSVFHEEEEGEGEERSRLPISAEAEERQERILNLVLSYGMSPKKKHEVGLMYAAITHLLKLCNAEREGENEVRTIINVGEGKGYVSRALSLAGGLQVVGLDCNPAHKEKALERIETLLEASCNPSQLYRGEKKDAPHHTPLNLLYEPRGHVASVACRVSESTDWAAIMRGHVRTVHVEAGVVTESSESPADENNFDCGDSGRLENVMESKMKCKSCGRILRRSFISLSRHAHQHIEAGDAALLPETDDRIKEWNRSLSLEDYTQKLVGAFFEPLSGRETNKKMLLPEPFRGVFVSRGYSLRVYFASKPFRDVFRDDSPPFMESNITVLGYDEASNLHQVVFNEEKCFGSMILAEISSQTAPNSDANGVDYLVDSSTLPPHSSLSLLTERPIGLVLRIFRPAPVLKPLVQVPSLANALMIGLHTCGDLGSNICRLFATSDSPGLVLVSCCWHALTESGFPMSQSIQRRGFSVHQISLLLATQPFDMWTTANTSGHRSSAKLLFYRSLTKLIWRLWKSEWEAQEREECWCCAFAPMPHLEPAFLRQMARRKNDILSFSSFFRSMLDYYIFDSTMHKTAYTWDNTTCEDCRRSQEAFFRRLLQEEKDMELETRYSSSFPSFLGLTVLRMWMCHNVEALLLLDRVLFLYESLTAQHRDACISLVPLFDGSLSPRLYGICVRRL